MGLYPGEWGPYMWRSLHIMALTYPTDPSKDRQETMLNFLLNMAPNLPCDGCATHCQMYMLSHPPQVQSNMALRHYLVDFHNAVNVRSGKHTLTFEEADKRLMTSALDTNDWRRLNRAASMRREDSAVIHQWKDAYQELESVKQPVWTIVTIIVLIILVMFLICVILRITTMNKKTK